MRTLPALLAAAALVWIPVQAGAQDGSKYPSRTVEIIVPLAAGGPNDIVARLVAHEFEAHFKSSFVVQNRPGAGSLVGTTQVANSAPDGHTLMVTSNSFAVNPTINPNAKYDPLRDFTPISLAAAGPQVLVARPDLGLKDVADLVERAKKDPGSVRFASPGIGTLPHLSYLLFQQRTGAEFNHIPFKGAGPSLNAIAGGHVDVMWVGVAPAIPHIRAGKLQALAVSTPGPVADLPGVPPAGKSVPGFEVTNRVWLVAPGKTPEAVVERIAQAAVEMAKRPSYRDALAKVGYEPGGTTPEETAKQVKEETETWAEVIRKSGLVK